jgi:cell shape-determining protein MreC
VYFCNEFTNKMTNKYEELVLAFESKLRKLISEYQTLQEQNNKLKADLERKHNDLMHAHQEVLEVRKNYNHLRTSLNLGVSDEERLESKKRIDKMVREIDKCLALLNE